MPKGIPVKLASELETDEAKAAENVNQVVVKKECSGPGEQVIHRKSERRRVARDIFLVFEEQPSRRQGRGGNRKRGPIKSKFGHLKVEDPSTNSRVKAGLLRDIKNEPKSFLTTPIVGKIPQTIATKPKVTNRTVNIKNKDKNKICANDVEKEAPTYFQNQVQSKLSTNNKDSASVNPIFLWAKQDDTRIIEVRCEDYDKRNRIRITKTTTGWRAIPRSDASTSRIVKYFQTPSSLIKLKREVLDNKLLMQDVADVGDVANLDDPADGASETTNSYISETTHEAIKSDLILMDQEKDLVHSNFDETNENERNLNDKFKTLNDISHEDLDEYNCEISCDVDECFGRTPESLANTDLATPSESQCSEMQDNSKESDNTSNVVDTYRVCTPDLQLCPRTGLFFPIDDGKESVKLGSEANDSGIHTDVTQCTMDTEHAPSDDSVIGSFDTDAANLKDLLDDADLLQHCSNNVSSGTDVIDSLVKHSCEQNLIEHNEMIDISPKISSKESIDEGIADTVLPPSMDLVDTEPSKCLSFDGTDEIEAVSGELYQISQNFADTFNSEPLADNNILRTETQGVEAIEAHNLPLRNSTSIAEGTMSINSVEIAPRDLSYKNNESACSIAEPQSQCAVTSSSDVLRSPEQDEVPVVESATETIKNFILEQFINLNALNTLPNTTIKKQNSEPIDLGKQKTGDVIACGQTSNSTGVIETVVIDDNSIDEPVKKKICSSNDNKIMTSANVTSNIDGDPDPLTQLQLLLRNTQWKVPDPILVPKDRLSAVLASPAREIPLLITTRPELRLPEAFAYPHIIQNPNILVISMAQLEAILKNEMEKMEKTQTGKDAVAEAFPNKNVNLPTKSVPIPKDLNTKCSYVEGNSMATDINTATLAVLNQMLWLPYFGQWSQDIIKTLKSPMGLQNQFTNFLSPYNHFPFGLQHLDELYKNYVKQISNIKLQQQQQHQSEADSPDFPTSPIYLRAMGAFQNHVDMMVLQKLLQQQIQNVSSTDQASSSTSSSSLSTSLEKHQNIDICNEIASNTAKEHHMHLLNEKSCTNDVTNLNLNASCTIDFNNVSGHNHSSDITNVTKKISADDSAELNKLSLINKNEILKAKPRLTCKSLSNLLEPGNRTPQAVPLINLATENPNQKQNQSQSQTNAQFTNYSVLNCQQTNANNVPTTNCEQVNSNTNEIIIEKQRQHNTFNSGQSQSVQVNKNSSYTPANGEDHLAFTNPFFNSNINGGYNSQWNWTTVTATGE